MYNNHRYPSLRPYLLTKIESFMKHGHIFSHNSEMNFAFITKFNKMTYEYFLKQPK